MDVSAELVRAAQSGDTAAMEDLIKASYRQGYTLALRLMRNPDDAVEATQDAFVRIVKSLKRLDEPGAYPTWMFRIVSNTCMSHLRRKGRIDVPTDLDTDSHRTPRDTEDIALEDMLREDLEKIVDTLPEVYRSVVILRDIYGMSGEEAAEALGVTSGAVKVRLHRAHRKLREEVLRRYPEWGKPDDSSQEGE